MSSQERIRSNIRDLVEQEIALEAELESVQTQLKQETLSEKKRRKLSQELVNLMDDLKEIRLDISILRELSETPQSSPDDRYDGWDEVFPAGEC